MIKRYLLLKMVLLLAASGLFAQTGGIRVQATIVPPYQQSILDYQSRPNQVVIILTNRDRSTLNVQLRARLTGDNGVIIRTKANYRSPRPLVLRTLQVLRLSAEDVAELFNLNSLEYINVKSSDITRRGTLPEGRYQLCIEPWEYSQNYGLGFEGCSNEFPVQSLEPPVIIKPMQEEAVNAIAPQNMVFTWTTPPSAPPSTEYVFKIVEVIGNRNPNDAMASNTRINALEEVVRTNAFLYSPAYPALLEGHRYAVQITARDPFQSTIFRNSGKSEVVVFTYGNSIAKKPDEEKPVNKKEPAVQYATNIITGKLLWAFKKTEEQFNRPGVFVALENARAGNIQIAGSNAPSNSSGNKPAAQAAVYKQPANSPVMVYAGHNTVQASMPVALGHADPTMNASYGIDPNTIHKIVAAGKATNELPDAQDMISSAGASAIEYNVANIIVDTGTQRYPLANMTVIIKGEKEAGKPGSGVLALANQLPGGGTKPAITPAQEVQSLGLRIANTTNTKASITNTPTANTNAGKILNGNVTGIQFADASILATGKTDAEGNFTISFLNPAYEGLSTYKNLIITVSSNDFDAKEFKIPVSELSKNQQIDLGTKTLLAKTYRFTPKLNLEKLEDATIENPSMVVRVYRDAADVENHPYLLQEGNVKASDKQVVIINGRRLIPVARDSVKQGGMLKPMGASSEFGFARLFYKGRLFVEIESSTGSFVKRQTELGVTDPKPIISQVVVVKPTYDIKLKFPSIQGQVVMYAGTSIVPIPGSVLHVEFNKEDVLAKSTGNGVVIGSTGISSTATVSSLANTPAKMLIGNSRAGTVKNTGSSSNAPSAQGMAALSSPYSVSAPMMVSAAGINATAGSFDFASVLAPGDESRSTTELISKYGAYTVKTDSSGQFFISNLPVLKSGANFTLKLVSVPNKYKDMETAPAEKQYTLAIPKGGMESREFGIKPEVVTIVGRAVDEHKAALPYARLHFKGSTSYFDAGETGLFTTSYFPGKHILIIEKEGFVTKEQSITIASGSGSSGNSGSSSSSSGSSSSGSKVKVTVPAGALTLNNTVGFAASINATTTVKNAAQSGKSITPALFGNAMAYTVNDNAFAAVAAGALHDNPYVFASPNTRDLGDVGFLLRKTGKIQFKIVDKDNNSAIAGATISLFDTTHVTDATGSWQYIGLGGNATVTVTPAGNTGYITLRTTVNVQENGTLATVTLKLEKGVRVYGKVTSGSQSVGGARIQADGFDYLQATADASGNYELYLPAGEQILKAAKSGFFTKTENRTLAKGTPLQVNFDLQGGGGKNISKLLGFDIELESSTPDGTGAKWTGKFVNLKPMSDVFKTTGTVSLAFNNIKVTFDGAGNPTPQGNEVVTDAVNIPLKLFTYLPVVLTGEPVIKVVKGTDGQGSIKGKLQIDINQIQGSRGFTFNKAIPLYAVPSTATGVADVELFHAGSGGNTPAAIMKLAQTTGNEAKLDLYGFTVTLNLAQSSINNNGLSLAGSVSTPALGPVSAIKIGIEEFTISKELRIQTVRIKASDLPTLAIASWTASLSNVVFSESGFKLGGNIKVTIPGSAPSSINFSNLALSKEALYGGQFAFPTEGFNLMNIVKLTTGSAPLSFNRVGNTNVYSIGGSASLKFDQLITKTINIPVFQIQTDGRFMVQAPVNYSADMGFAKFTLQSLTISTLSGQAPYIGIVGEFKSELSVLKFSASEIKFKAKAGGGSEFSVGAIAATLDIPVMKVGLQIGLKDNGFSGAGQLGIPSTPISAEVAFHYFKVPGGVDVGASFKSGIIIPIGIVTIEQVGGGFAYNTATRSFMININGAASITGTGTVVKLNPIGLTVESGPVITGYAGIEIASAFSVAQAKMVLDVPGKTFAVSIDATINPMAGVASASVKGLLRISWNKDDAFVFLGCGMQAKLLGIVDAYGDYAIGINLKNPRNRGDDISYYFSHLDADLAQSDNAVFSGIYLHTGCKVGDKNKKYGFDIEIASAEFWFEANSEVLLYMNFAQGEYKFKLKGYLGAGADLCAVGLCIGGSFEACYAFMGGRNQAKGWYVGGQAAGRFDVRVGGCDPGCNSIDLCWPWDGLAGFQVCANAHAKIDISEKQGVSFSGGAGGNKNFNGCQ